MKRLMILAVLLLVVVGAWTKAISPDQALRVAENWINERSAEQYQAAAAASLEKDLELIYVVSLKPTGYVLIAADDASLPVLGYSTHHAWNEYDVPPQLLNLLESWQEQLQDIRTRNLPAGLEATLLWQKYDKAVDSFVPHRNIRNAGPLMTTLWGQGTYYNAQCPGGSMVGCVATAMSQIMRYWSFPSVGSGTYSYTHPTYGTQTANFGATAYNWAAMPNRVLSSNPAVATISYHAGVSVNMNYSPSGSGAYSTAVPNALKTYFKYATSTELKYKGSYSSTNWENLIKSELDNGRPVYYGGSSSASGGHAFVVDGYQGSNFHVNWGWNGSYDGYYSFTALNPGGENFTQGQEAVIGIAPTSSLPLLSEGFEGTTFPPDGWSITASTFVRSTTNAISGSYSARYNVTATGTASSGKRLITPQVIVDNTTPDLTFKGRNGAASAQRGEKFKVGYSSSATGPWTYFPTDATLSTTAQTFTYVINTLSPGSYYFVFETYTANTGSNSKTWIIDDIAGPYKDIPTQASLNITSWDAGTMAPGDQARSGNVFTLSNVGGGELTITSITNLAATDFSTNINTNVRLVYGQTHDFGFNYEPLDYGTDNVNFQIVTNAGTVSIALNGSAQYGVLDDGFESYQDFALNFSPWTQYDGDGATTYTIQNVSFTNQGYTGSFIIFNPTATSPAVNSAEAHGGSKYAACFAATTPPNNDWLISPQLTLSSSAILSFWARSYTTQYPEAFRVLYSTTTNTYSAFTNYLAGSASTSISPGDTWTQYSYTLPQTARYFAIQCVSNDAFFFMVDDIKVSDGSTPPPPTFGNLSGYVYRSGTTTPISNALITVGTKETHTNASGFYQINNILTGTVTVNCSAPGMFYHPSSQSGVQITLGNTTTQDFGLTWGELVANPSSVAVNLYQGETGSSQVVLSNPGGTAPTLYAGYIASATRAERKSALSDIRKPHASKNGTEIAKIAGAPAIDRGSQWFSYADIGVANYFSGSRTERGNYFVLSDFALMDGALTLSQLRSYFYNPASAAWTSTTHRQFKWKIYTVSPEGSVANVHTSDTITLPTTATNNYALAEYTLPSPIIIPAGYDFLVTVAPASTTDTSGRPQSLATDASGNNGIVIDSSGNISLMGLDVLLDAYIEGTEWMSANNFSGSIPVGGQVTIPLNFNAVDVSEGTKYAQMYVYNDAHYLAPDARGDVMVIPISLNVSIPTEPVAMLIGDNSWQSFAEVGSPASSGNIFTLKNGGTGTLTISSITGLSGTPFSTTLTTSIALAPNQTHSFGFSFNPQQSGIWETTFTINTNGGSKSINLKGYGNYSVESFENEGFPPDGWMLVDSDGDGNNWIKYAAANSAHTGNYSAASASYINDSKAALEADKRQNSERGVLTPDNWLITPRLAVPTGGILGFWVAAQDPSYPQDHYSVLLSTTTNQISAFTTNLYSETLMSGDWQYHEINLNSYAGQEVYIAFRHHDSTDWFMMKIDDVLLPPLAAPLLYGNVSGRIHKAGTDEYLGGVTVSVAGRSVTTGEDGAFSINNLVVDSYPITATKAGYVSYNGTVNLVANQTVTHNFGLNYAQFYAANTSFNVNVAAEQSADITLNLANTGTAALDWEAGCGIWGGLLFEGDPLDQDFEYDDMEGWTGSIGPNSNIYIGYGHDSQSVWAFASAGINETQYIVTPKLRVNTGDNLSFWYKQFNNLDEVLHVLISTTGNDIASFTELLSTVGPLTDTEWHQFQQSLSAFAGQDIYVAFYYPRIDGNEYGYILIDDIQGPTTLEPATDWLSVEPETGTIAAGGNNSISLVADSSDLPMGTYTAQAWFFGTATNSPYKVYVSMTVGDALSLSAPADLVIEQFDEGISFGWTPVDNASGYHLYASNNPYTGFIYLDSVEEDNYMEISFEDLQYAGINTERAFFHITADNPSLSIAQRQSTVNSNAMPLKYQMQGKRVKALLQSN